MRRRVIAAMIATVAVSAAACTEVSTDPNAVAAIQFDNAGYPSVVAGDSLRDSLGILLPLSAIALNNDGDPIEGAEIVYSSPDTVLRMDPGGVVFARGLNPGGAATRVFATVGSLQSQSVSLLTVSRADTMTAVVEADTTSGQIFDEAAFNVRGDTVASTPRAPIPGWLVSFQLRYRGALLPAGDSSVAYPMVTAANRRIPMFVDTTDAQGRAGRQVFLRSPRLPEDTIYLIARTHRRKQGTTPLTAETRLIFRQGGSPSRVP